MLALFEDVRDFIDDIQHAVRVRLNWRRFRKELGFTSNQQMQDALEFTDYEMSRLVFPDHYPAFVVDDLLTGAEPGRLIGYFAEAPEFWDCLIRNEWPEPSAEDMAKVAAAMSELGIDFPPALD